MGYGTRPGQLGHTIRTYWPDDDETTIFIDASTAPTLEDLMAKIDEKWPGSSWSNIQIDCQEIQTDCLGYDAYDSTDHTNFLIITKNKGA